MRHGSSTRKHPLLGCVNPIMHCFPVLSMLYEIFKYTQASGRYQARSLLKVLFQDEELDTVNLIRVLIRVIRSCIG